MEEVRGFILKMVNLQTLLKNNETPLLDKFVFQHSLNIYLMSLAI